MTKTRVPHSECPVCGYTLTGATGAFDPTSTPKPGDLSVCAKCAAPLVFNSDLTIRLLSDTELQALPPGEADQLRRAQNALRRHPWTTS
jgi:hypothetical protein